MAGASATASRPWVLSGEARFDRVFADGQRTGTRFFRIRFAAGESDGARLGMAIGRRVHKHAVVRNRLRRQIRESFRLIRPKLPRLDVVVMAKPDAVQANRNEIWADLLWLWARLPR